MKISISQLAEKRQSEQFYGVSGEAVMTAEEIEQYRCSISESTNSFGTAMFLNVGKEGQLPMKYKVQGDIADKIRDTKKPLGSIIVDPSTVLITILDKTEAANNSEEGKKMRQTIYRAQFSWA